MGLYSGGLIIGRIFNLRLRFGGLIFGKAYLGGVGTYYQNFTVCNDMFFLLFSFIFFLVCANVSYVEGVKVSYLSCIVHFIYSLSNTNKIKLKHKTEFTT